MPKRNESLYTPAAKDAARAKALEERPPLYGTLDAIFRPLGYELETGVLDVRRVAEESGHSRTSFYSALSRGKISARMVRKLDELHTKLTGKPIPAERFLPHML